MKKSAVLIIGLCLAGAWVTRLEAEEALTWQDCLSQAQKNNPELLSATEAIKQKESAKSITASGLYPSIDASLSVSTSGTSATSSQTGITTKSTADSYSYGVSGSQLIFDGFKTGNDIKAASENIRVSQQAYRFTSSQVRFALRSAFVNLLKAQELIKVAEEIVAIRRDNLILITLRYESGLEHKGALLTAEANLAQAEFELAQAKRNLSFVQRQLSKEMGQKEFIPLSVKGHFMVVDTAKEKPVLEDLLKVNPAVLQAAYRKNAAAFDIQSAYAKFAPSLTGSAQAGKKSATWPPRNNQWDLGLSVNLPLFEGGLRIAELTQARSAYRQAQADERSAGDTALVSLEETWATLQDAQETVEVQSKILAATQERSRIAQAQYSTGFIDFDSWIIIEDDLVGAKKSYLQALANALLAEAQWIQAKGETIEYAQ